MGHGDKLGADGAAVDAMRVVLESVPMDAIVVIGEGEKESAAMLYNGERIGNGTPPFTDIAVDPIDGTTLCSLGRGNALSVIALSDRGTMFNPGPCFYTHKIAAGPEGAGVIDLIRSATENLEALAKVKGESVRDLTAVILDPAQARRAHRRGAGRKRPGSGSLPTAAWPVPFPLPGLTRVPTFSSRSGARRKA